MYWYECQFWQWWLSRVHVFRKKASLKDAWPWHFYHYTVWFKKCPCVQIAFYSKRNVKNLDSERGERNCNIRTRLIYASSHCRGQISASAMTVLSGEQMAVLVRRRKEGDTLQDTLKGWPHGAGFLHYKVRQWLIKSVLTENKLKWLTSRCSYESNQNTVTAWNAVDKLDKETFNTGGINAFAQKTGLYLSWATYMVE